MSTSLMQNNSNLVSRQTDKQVSAVHSTNVAANQALAEIQGKILMAKNFPRDITNVINKIQASCERESLAKVAEYQYKRGTTLVQGASIKLLEVIAQCYGNISYSWKEIERKEKEHLSLCKAVAWDLENNINTELEFEVSHYRDTKLGKVLITDSDRDLYEHIAAQAMRRLRKCLEMVVPRDLVEKAVEICRESATRGIDVQKQIDKAIIAFNQEFKVTAKMLEEYFGYSRQAFNNNTYLALQRLYISIKDGFTTVEEVFPKINVNVTTKQNAVFQEVVAEEKVKKTTKTNNNKDTVVNEETGEVLEAEEVLPTQQQDEKVYESNLFGSAKKI